MGIPWSLLSTKRSSEQPSPPRVPLEEGSQLKEAQLVVETAIGHVERGEFNQGLFCLRQSRTLLEANVHAGSKEGAISLLRSGSLYLRLGHHVEAQEALEEALAIMVQRADPVQLDPFINALGALHEAKGEYVHALAYNQDCLVLRRRFFPEDTVRIVEAQHNIGRTLMFQGKGEEALSLLEESLKSLQELARPRASSLATNLDMLATLYLDMGKYPRAIALYQRCLKLKEQKLPPGHPGIRLSLNKLGLAFKAAENYNEALKIFTRCLDIARTMYGSEEGLLKAADQALCHHHITELHQAIAFHRPEALV